MNYKLNLLGGLSINDFLRDYWQKKPLLIRQAMPGFTGFLDPEQLKSLSCSADAQARLVTNKRGKWHLHEGPFEAENYSALGKTKWTVLVQGVNHILPEAAELLKRFDFIPHTRLDDLMVSYAPPAGGVGPHFDSYDVFLLQGLGKRRWQISSQKDRTLVTGAPLRILQNFSPEQEWILEPGDMLYLPPHWAHNGIAEDDCMTYSIGFRTPSYQELGEQFLVSQQDRICLEGMYADPDLKRQRHPSEISADMLNQVQAVIQQIQWGKADIADFLGSYLSEPKPHIYFSTPKKPYTRKQFQRSIAASGISLDLKTLFLCHDNNVYINGIKFPVDKGSYLILRTFADNRHLPASPNLPEAMLDMLYEWYLDGYVHPAALAGKASS